VAEHIPGAALAIAVERGGGEADRHARADRAIRRAAEARVVVRRGMDGRPEVVEVPLAVSASHAGDLTLAVAGHAPLGCDLEPVSPRPPAVWRDLLGPAGFALAEEIGREAGEGFDTAATRVWSAREALKKAGVHPSAPMVASRGPDGGWVTMDADGVAVATCAVALAADGGEHVAAVAAAAGSSARPADTATPRAALAEPEPAMT
jgi:enediyne polyketide synthase